MSVVHLPCQGRFAHSCTRRQHRKIAAQLLTPKSIQGYNDVLDYEARIMIRSMYLESCQGALPINPAHYTGRYTLK